MLYVCELPRSDVARAGLTLTGCKVVDAATELSAPDSPCGYSIAPKGAEDPRVVFMNQTRYVVFTGADCQFKEGAAQAADMLQLSAEDVALETKRTLVWDKQLLNERLTVWLLRGDGKPRSLTAPKQQQVEKNWIPFVSMDRLFVSYLLSPAHQVLSLNVETGATEEFGTFSNAVLEAKATIDGWTPSVRGGTTYVQVGEYYIAMCHARYPYADVTDQRKRSLGLTGYMHFWYAIPQTPPFDIVAASKAFKLPVSISKEELQPHIAESAVDIQFASGLVRDENHLVVSYGQADCGAGIARYKISRVLAALGLSTAGPGGAPN
jgi:hypothetical protein